MATTRMVDEKEETSSKEHATRKSQNGDKDEPWCPLFSEGLPSDFASNSKLAAIASLLNDGSTDVNGDIDSKHSDGHAHENHLVDLAPGELSSRMFFSNLPRANSSATLAGGGKAKPNNKRRQRKSGMPYDKEKHAKSAPTKVASVGEAQLFLHLWKL